jgi:hypothetical protein
MDDQCSLAYSAAAIQDEHLTVLAGIEVVQHGEFPLAIMESHQMSPWNIILQRYIFILVQLPGLSNGPTNSSPLRCPNEIFIQLSAFTN